MTLQAGYCFLDALILIPKVLSDPWQLGVLAARSALEVAAEEWDSSESMEHRRAADTARPPAVLVSPETTPCPHCKLLQEVYRARLSILPEVYSQRFPAIWFRGKKQEYRAANITTPPWSLSQEELLSRRPPTRGPSNCHMKKMYSLETIKLAPVLKAPEPKIY